ncbi:hypothetical protein F4808DRAFT_219919 [Astrocystis sublimbata]|nr:hypothetical protein F4808DRAFT_219919 [Astrocystis sublimbata]
MAAPATKTIGDLSGKWVLNKTLSDPTDPALALQGIGWLLRKGISAATVTIAVKQYVDASSKVTRIDVDQSASGLSSTHEARTLDWSSRSHKDWLFGAVEGRSKFISSSELSALVAADGEARKEGWVDSAFLSEDWLEGDEEQKGDEGKSHVISHVKAEAGWFATQIWGFQNIGGERRHVRNVVVSKGDKFVSFKMIYDFVE